MRNFIIIIFIVVVGASCVNNDKINPCSFLPIDTIVVDFKPNLIIRTMQFLNDDSRKNQVAKEEYYNGNILLKEIYRNYWTSEFDGYADGDCQYFYNKDKKLLYSYFIDFHSGDTSKSVYQYLSNKRDFNVILYDLRKRLKPEAFHRDTHLPNDYFERRTWAYVTMWAHKFDKRGNLIQLREQLKDFSSNQYNNYLYEYRNNKLLEETGYIDDTIRDYTEQYKYESNRITMTHINFDRFPIPFYYIVSELDNNGNPIIQKRIHDNNKLVRKYIKSYDNRNRLITMDCYDENNNLRVSHRVSYLNLE